MMRLALPVLLALSALPVASPLVAQQKADTTRPAPRTIPELEARIRDVLARTHTPGIGLALVTRDSVLYTGGLGLADVASKRPATARTLFRIGSTSKAFTSLAVLMLQEEGKLRLEDSLRKFIPEIRFENRWEATDPVRIVNALEHSTGFDDWAMRDYADSDPTPKTLRQGLDFDPSTRVSRWRPGTRVSYSNTGPPLAAYIVEKLEGRPFEEVVHDRLFAPIGMKTATYLHPDTTVTPLATLYAGEGKTPNPYWHVLMRPAGSINASAEDMAQYVKFLLDRGAVNGQALLPPSAIDRLERTEASNEAKAGLPVGYGLHMSRYVDSGFVWTGHDGGVNGGLTNMAYIPELGVGFAFMINAGNGKALEEIGRLVRDFVTMGHARPTPPPRGAMPEVARTTYAGWYRPDNPRQQHLYFAERLLGLVRVKVTDTSFVVTPLLSKAARYVPVSGMTFRGEREPVATLALVADSADGRPVAIERMGYLLPTSLVHVSAPVAWAEVLITFAFLVGLVLTVLALLLGIGRLALRRGAVASTARTIWRVSIAAALTLLCGLFALAQALSEGGAFAAGKPNVYTIGGWLMFLAFAAFALAGAVLAFRRTPRTADAAIPGGSSLGLARIVAALNFVAAAYLVYWGFIGWRMWA